jgi:hypothetical protein
MVRGLAMLNKKLLGSVSSLPSDDNFENVTLLLNGDGTNGAQNNTFLDSSTNNFTITRNGNTTQGSFSPYGSNWGNYFPAGGNYAITTPASANTSLGSGDFTIEGWVFTNSFGSFYNMLVCKWDFPNKEWFVYFTASGITFGLSTDGTSDSAAFTTSTTIPLNTWCHIAVTRSGSSLYTFLNGVLLSTNSITQTFYASTQLTAIGNFPSSGISDTGMRGYVSNVRLVKGTALYTATFTPSTTPLTAVSGTQLLTCQSNRFLDNSSNNFTVTATSSNSVQRFSPFNPTAPYSTSVIGGSGYFDGSGDYLRCNDNAAFQLGSGDFTLEAWVYLPQNPPLYDGTIASYGTSGQFAGFSFSLTGSNQTPYRRIIFGVNYATGFFSTGTVNLNTWNHLAVSRSGSNLYLFINGVLDSTQSASFTINTSSADYMYVGTQGYDPGSTDRSFTGYISNFRMVKGTALYTSSFTPSTTPLTAVSGTSLLTNMTNAGIPDLAMQNNLETVGNAQVSTSVKKYGTGSLAFDGTGDYLVTRNIAGTQLQTGDFTIECWAYFNSVSNGTILDKRAGDTRGILIYFGSSGTLSLAAGDSNSSAWEVRFDKSSLTTGVWYHVAFVRSGNDFYGFVDGTQISTSQSSSMTIDDTGANYFIGTLSGGSEQLNAYIDDMRITKGVARYTANFTPPTKALETF